MRQRLPISSWASYVLKIQELGLSKIYSEYDSDTAKWLSHTFGLAYLDPQEVEDSEQGATDNTRTQMFMY